MCDIANKSPMEYIHLKPEFPAILESLSYTYSISEKPYTAVRCVFL